MLLPLPLPLLLPPQLLLLLQQMTAITPQVLNFVWAAYVSSSFQPVRMDPRSGPAFRNMVGRTNLLSATIPCQTVANNSVTPGYVVSLC
jgi:hypothetical protein